MIAKTVSAVVPKHGKRGTPEYKAWDGMVQRCRNPRCLAYHNYGGRGITFCERWRQFSNFLADMGLRPTPKHQIDRIDNNGNYCPENCKWSTKKEQANNRRTNRLLTYKGEVRNCTEWSKLVGIADKVIRKRLDDGWTVEEALETPVKQQKTPKP